MAWGPSTFSIVACDMDTGEYGVAIGSSLFAVGAAVPHVRAGVGAVATQWWVDPDHGPRALRLLEEGAAADAVLRELVSEDAWAKVRQIGVVDREGRAAGWTGPKCTEWAGHIVGDAFCCQGSQLAGRQVLEAMAEAFRSTVSPLPERLVAALEAGWQAGGGSRGSAALQVARVNSGCVWSGDRYIDIRADHHHEPVRELARLLRAYRMDLWGRLAEPVVVLDSDLIQFIQLCLRQQGRLTGERPGQWDTATHQALASFCADFHLEVPLPLDGVALPRMYFRGLMEELIR